MSIYVDGERSRQRLGFAKSMLNKIKAMGLRTKKLIYDGFLYRVDNIAPGLSKIAVTAPMGAAVICSQSSGIKLFTADYWLGGFSGGRDVYVSNLEPSEADLNYHIMTNVAVPATKCLPNAETISPDEVNYYPATNPQPQISGFATSEFFWVSVSLEPTQTPYPPTAFSQYETFLNFYQSSGNTAKRIGISYEGHTYAVQKMCAQRLASTGVRTAEHYLGWYLHTVPPVGAQEWLVCSMFTGNELGMDHTVYTLNTAATGVPSDLYDLLVQVVPSPGAASVGTYVFADSAAAQPTVLHCVFAISSYLDTNYYNANPSMVPWRLFYSIYTLGAGSIATYPVDTALLNTKSGGYVSPGGVLNWYNAWRFLTLFFPWPNAREFAAPDSAMFHSANGDVYSWTRKYGAIKFTTTGMFSATLTLPPYVVSNPGTRPELYHVGGDEYVCVAFKPGKLMEYSLPADQAAYDADWNGVRGLFYGSPFSGWVDLPMPDEGYRLLHVQIVSAADGDCTMLGVITESSTPENYFHAILDYKSGAGAGTWVKLSKIPADVVDVDKALWAIGLFGDGVQAKNMREFVAPAPVLPQMPAAPYSVYAGITP
jgi:hypothetical protein